MPFNPERFGVIDCEKERAGSVSTPALEPTEADPATGGTALTGAILAFMTVANAWAAKGPGAVRMRAAISAELRIFTWKGRGLLLIPLLYQRPFLRLWAIGAHVRRIRT